MIMVRGVKLRVDYVGQPKTCSRCMKVSVVCPGGAKADKCKKAGGEEVKLSTFFKKLVKSLKKDGKTTTDAPRVDAVVPTYVPDPDEVRFTGFAEDTKLDVFKKWLDANGINYLDPMVFQGKKPTPSFLACPSWSPS